MRRPDRAGTIFIEHGQGSRCEPCVVSPIHHVNRTRIVFGSSLVRRETVDQATLIVVSSNDE
jgi:hypothetical protein